MKLYKITLNISLAVFLILFAFSVFMKQFFSNWSWYNFVFNYVCGIACSAVVVFVTTLLQYKGKQSELLNIVLNRTCSLFVKLNDLYERQDSIEIAELNSVSNMCFEIIRAGFDLKFYSWKEQRKIAKIFLSSMNVKQMIDKNLCNSAKDIYFNVLMSDDILELGNNAISLKYRNGCQESIKEEMKLFDSRNSVVE